MLFRKLKNIFHSMNENKHIGKSSEINNETNELPEIGETEIAVQISVPKDGGWGWVVVAAAFLNIYILDGVTYTFGSILPEISKDLILPDSLVAVVNSVAVALYFIGSPIASALINRFGFRECAMSGGVICSIALFCSHFATDFPTLCLFYGFMAGLGYSLINVSSSLIVGFYFERLRSLAMSITSCGSSIGVMTLFPVNVSLVKISGWRSVTLLHSGLLGLTFFFGMAYKTLPSFIVTSTGDATSTRTVTYLPSLNSEVMRPTVSGSKTEGVTTTASERLFSAVSNINYPTAATVIQNDLKALAIKSEETEQPGPSVSNASRITLSTNNKVSLQELKEIHSLISRTSEANKLNIDIRTDVEQTRRQTIPWWKRFFHWEPHVPESRPLYRDDVFYDRKVEELPTYQKNVMEKPSHQRTGLEYQLAVSRAVAIHDLQESKGVFTTAVRRVLATMMDTSLLKKNSYLLLCSSGFLTYLGLLVPYVYLRDRNVLAGLQPDDCKWLISLISLSNAFGRLVLGSLASRFDPLKLFAFSCTIAGLSTIMSDLSYNLYYQYIYCCIFGFFISCVACLRSLILVSLYGLDKLTNATGMMLIFLGIGNLFSTPMAGLLKNNYGYDKAFCVAGIFITLSGLILIPVRAVSLREQINNEKKTNVSTTKEQTYLNKTEIQNKTTDRPSSTKPETIKIK